MSEAPCAPGDKDRPLVTFALFAYNQEQYVREAIEAAFAQTYEPLEIILSDDCSSDSTYAIMQEMAAAYRGPHQVIARQSPQNRRVLRHVLDVARLAQGKYMVVAAGDDVSMPQRTNALVELFERESADFCWSAYRTFGDTRERYFEDDYALTSNILGLQVDRIYGATAAYRRSTINRIPEIDEPIFYEDSFLEIFAAIAGAKVRFCPEELVAYRILDNSLSMKTSEDAFEFETRLAVHFARLGETALLACDTFCDEETLRRRPDLRDFRRLAAYYRRLSSWKGLRLRDRIALLLQVPDRKAFKWFLPRAVLGWQPFLALKKLQLSIK